MEDFKPKSTRGGARPGAGRKPKSGSLSLPPDVVAAAARLPRAPAQDRPKTVKDLEGLALETLKQVMESCPQDPPRVSAAMAVLRHSRKDAVLKAGKKEARAVVAEEHMEAGGRFSAPPPPGAFN